MIELHSDPEPLSLIEFKAVDGSWKPGVFVGRVYGRMIVGCDQTEVVGWIESQAIRLRKTPDQIAAEERSLACDRIYGIITGPGVERKGNTSDMAEALYDAGLRFTEVEK